MKYVSVVIMALSVILTGVGLVAVNRHFGAVGATARPVADSAQIEAEQEAQSVAQVATGLARLQPLLDSGSTASAVVAVGSPGTKDKSAEHAPYKLTMLYFGSNFRRAVIDGQMVSAGDELKDGSKILAINRSNVVIRENGAAITLAIPQDRIVIGSVHNEQAKRDSSL